MVTTTARARAQDRTREVLRAMLLENTGRALCDSGGYPQYDSAGKYVGSSCGYGRAYERNQGRDFEHEASSYLEARVYKGKLDLILTHSVYHWLAERLEFSAELDSYFSRFVALRNTSDCWLQEMERFGELVHKKWGAGGIYGEGEPMTVNSYNGEDLLSQTIQYLYFEVDSWAKHHPFSGAFVLLQIHGGADVRGGYTRPRAFEVSSELAIFDNARATLYPELPKRNTSQLPLIAGCEPLDPPYWYSDDGYHFYGENLPRHAPRHLSDYPASEDPADKGQGIIYVDEDRNLYCPVSGLRLLPSA